MKSAITRDISHEIGQYPQLSPSSNGAPCACLRRPGQRGQETAHD
jgi:hypothetical protein